MLRVEWIPSGSSEPLTSFSDISFSGGPSQTFKMSWDASVSKARNWRLENKKRTDCYLVLVCWFTGINYVHWIYNQCVYVSCKMLLLKCNQNATKRQYGENRELYHQSVSVKVRNMRAQLIYNLINRLPQAVFPHRECVPFFYEVTPYLFQPNSKKWLFCQRKIVRSVEVWGLGLFYLLKDNVFFTQSRFLGYTVLFIKY